MALDRPLSRRELALLIGQNETTVRYYEGLRELPPAVSQLLDISLALRVPLDTLIAPAIIEEREAQISKRRELLTPPHLPGAVPDDGHV